MFSWWVTCSCSRVNNDCPICEAKAELVTYTKKFWWGVQIEHELNFRGSMTAYKVNGKRPVDINGCRLSLGNTKSSLFMSNLRKICNYQEAVWLWKKFLVNCDIIALSSVSHTHTHTHTHKIGVYVASWLIVRINTSTVSTVDVCSQ